MTRQPAVLSGPEHGANFARRYNILFDGTLARYPTVMLSTPTHRKWHLEEALGACGVEPTARRDAFGSVLLYQTVVAWKQGDQNTTGGGEPGASRV